MNRSVSGQYHDGYADEHDEGSDRSFAEQLDLQHYLRILRKHKWPITLFTAAVTALAAYYAYTATPIYRSTSTLLIEQQKAAISIEELYGVESENADYYETQFQLLKSRSLAQRVVDKLGLWEHPEFASSSTPVNDGGRQDAVDGEPATGLASKIGDLAGSLGLGGASDDATAEATLVMDESAPTMLDADKAMADGDVAAFPTPDPVARTDGSSELTIEQERVLAAFQKRLSVAPVRKTKLVNISFESADPVLAARVANTVGQQYITAYLDSKLEMTNKAQEWLGERLGTLKTQLDEAEDRLIAFKQENGLVDVDGGVARLNEQQLLLLTAELAQARSELASARDIAREVTRVQDQPDLLQSIPAIQADALVQGVRIQQGTAQRELDELRNRYGDRHPRVVDAIGRLASLDNTLQGHIRRVIGTVQKDLQLAEQRVASINANLASGKSDIQAIGNKKFELDALQREVTTKQGIYDQFYSRISEANSADGLETANARVSDYARPPVAPVKPKKQLIIALAALASLVLSMLMAFLYETMDDTVKSTNDIEGKLGLKLLGILPLIKGGMFGRNQELPLDPTQISDKKGTFSESVNTARTALTLDEGEGGRKVVMVTSSVPGEGKSTAAINLAYSFAQLERVLLIDCDLRRPTVAKAAGLDKNVTGLSNLITRTATARECIKRGMFGGTVDVLPSGPIPDQPLELLSSARFAKILEQLSDHYDRIVIDSAPTQAVSDALVLSKLCDGVVYVVKSHDTSLDLVKRGVQRLEQVKARLAGVLITQVDIDKITSYGGDYYYQGYYDYYGYTEKGEKTRAPGKIRLTQDELISMKNDDEDFDLGLGQGTRGRSTKRSTPRTAPVALDADLGSQRPMREAVSREEAPTVLSRRMRDDLDIL